MSGGETLGALLGHTGSPPCREGRPSVPRKSALIVGRIFLSPRRFRQGLGRQLMSAIEALNTRHLPIVLDTPCWNARTLSFYRRCGYIETHRDADSVFFRKECPQSSPSE